MKSSRSSMRCTVILLVSAHHVEEAELAEPVAVAVDLGLVDVDDLADLRQVVAGVGLDLLLRSAGRASGRGRWGRRRGRCSCR